jgi:hypothetical protein
MEDEMTSKRFKRGIRWKIEKGNHRIFGKNSKGNLRRDFLMRLEVNSKRIREEICYGYVYSNTNKTQTPNKLKSTDTLLQTTLYECIGLFVCLSYV